MKTPEEMVEANKQIPTEEILTDIRWTRSEVETYQAELDVLRKNPVENKLQIYLREGKISKRIEFIENLERLLGYRQKLEEIKSEEKQWPTL